MASELNEFTVFVLDGTRGELGWWVRGVRVDSLRGADFAAQNRRAWQLGAPPCPVVVSVGTSESYEVPAAPSADSFNSFLTRRVADLKQRMLYTGVQNVVYLRLGADNVRFQAPTFVSTIPGLSPTCCQVEVELLIEKCRDFPDFAAYSDYVLAFGKSGYTVSVMNQVRDRVYEDLIALAENTAPQPGLCLPATARSTKHSAPCVLLLKEATSDRTFIGELHLLGAVRVECGDIVSRLVRWYDGAKLNQKSADIARIVSTREG